MSGTGKIDSFVMQYALMGWPSMKYSELIDSGATPTEIQSFLVESENVSVTMRMPKNLRDSAKEAAALSGMSLSAFMKNLLIERLSKGGRQ